MKMRLQFFLMLGTLVLSFTAEKCRQLVGEESSSKTWNNRFTFLNCFDISYGTIACVIKELLKLYLYYIRAVYVHKVRADETEAAMREALSGDQRDEEAIKNAKEKGNAAARRASMEAKHIMGSILSSGWDPFMLGAAYQRGLQGEQVHFWGLMLEGLLEKEILGGLVFLWEAG